MSDKKLIIIDSSSLLYRAFHALPPLTNAKGQPTGGVYGFLLTLLKAIKDVEATHVVACFDTPKPTFRHQEFKEYKAHRVAPPDALISQFSILKEVVKALGIPIFEKEGFEADDLIATIATRVTRGNMGDTRAPSAEGARPSTINGALVFIVSGDLDNLQLVDKQIKLYTLGKGIKDPLIYDEQKVVERFGVAPEQMNDFKALVGDASDNIPGVPGIGKTTASELIKTYGSVENLYAELTTDTAVLKPKVKEALKQNKDKALLSLKLVQTDLNVPIEFEINDCKFGTFNQQNVKNIFLELGFHSLIERIGAL